MMPSADSGGLMKAFKEEYDFLKARYDFEHQRRINLLGALSVPVGFLTALGGLLAVMARQFSYPPHWITTLFMAGLAGSVCAFGVSLYYLAKAFWRQEVAYLQSLPALQDSRRIIRRHRTKAAADLRFSAYLRRSIIAATDLNAVNNVRREGFLFRARTSLLVVAVLTAVLGLLYVADHLRFRRTDSRGTPSPGVAEGQTMSKKLAPISIVVEGQIPPKKKL